MAPLVLLAAFVPVGLKGISRDDHNEESDINGESENNKVGFWETFRSIATNRLFVVFTLGPKILQRTFVD